MKEKRAGAVLGAAGGLIQGEMLVSTKFLPRAGPFGSKTAFALDSCQWS
jgi:hypothetical protein